MEKDELNNLPKAALSKEAGNAAAGNKSPQKIVIPDECGDSLWDEVLAQYPDEASRVQPGNKDQDVEKEK
ncbi:MAG: hypothetical protein EOO04_36125 [Chitinophagaceae bacterium]|nr:MAG: hypothetical protein EOO04_36125 [Chitinophagaceae bacterium]